MNKKARNQLAKALGLIGLVLLVTAFILMAMGRLSYGWFWAIVVFAAFLGFMVIPRIRGESSSFLNWLHMKKD